MNLFFWRKQEIPKLVFETDHHSHILPGVDDGVRTLEDSLDILSDYEKLGIKTVWCTPHIMEDCPNTTEDLKERFAMLKESYKGPIKLNLAAEYMMDTLFHRRYAAGDLLTMDGMLLVETSYFNPPANLDETLSRIMSQGRFPILAHPERYMYMEKDDYKRLKEAGVKFQMNMGSIKGYYGRHAQAKALWLLRKGFYDFYGSDLHRRQMVALLEDK